MKQQFIFNSYTFDEASKTLELKYSYNDGLEFTEKYLFDFDFVKYDKAALNQALQALFLMAGVSYYKLYLAEIIVVNGLDLDEASAAFFSKTYQKGLGEFFYVNKLDPRTPVTFPYANTSVIQHTPNGNGQLIGVGGGKDSLLSIELLRNQPNVATWSLGHTQQLQPLVERIGLNNLYVERTIDPKLLELNNDPNTYNGHIPISAIFSCVGVVIAILSGYKDVVVSNENSANEPTLSYQGIGINHQYSKSLEYEQEFQQYLKRHFGNSIRYYSFLRPLSEVYVAELFARYAFNKYKDVFSSCNRAYRQGEHQLFWCGECPKCAFVFLALTPFLPRADVEALWGKNLLKEPGLDSMYQSLLGIEGDKPLECVGEIKENRSAMRLAFKQYPELTNKYSFELPADFNYKALAQHSMPEDIAKVLFDAL